MKHVRHKKLYPFHYLTLVLKLNVTQKEGRLTFATFIAEVVQI